MTRLLERYGIDWALVHSSGIIETIPGFSSSLILSKLSYVWPLPRTTMISLVFPIYSSRFICFSGLKMSISLSQPRGTTKQHMVFWAKSASFSASRTIKVYLGMPFISCSVCYWKNCPLLNSLISSTISASYYIILTRFFRAASSKISASPVSLVFRLS